MVAEKRDEKVEAKKLDQPKDAIEQAELSDDKLEAVNGGGRERYGRPTPDDVWIRIH